MRRRAQAAEPLGVQSERALRKAHGKWLAQQPQKRDGALVREARRPVERPPLTGEASKAPLAWDPDAEPAWVSVDSDDGDQGTRS